MKDTVESAEEKADARNRYDDAKELIGISY
jgi:hypothetical protein